MDLKAIGEDLGLDEEEFLEIVELFMETAKLDINRLRQALSSTDIQGLNEAAHSLKGSAGNLGFTEIYGLCKEIENAIRENTLASIGPVLDVIEKVKATIQASLNAGPS